MPASPLSKSANGWNCSPETKRLALERLEESGIDPKGAVHANIMALDAPKVRSLGPTMPVRPALQLIYMDPWNPKQALRAFPAWPEFFRLRLLGQPPADFKANTESFKEMRYTQPPDTGVCAYFSKLVANWPAILADPAATLVITEGELKATKACQEGIPTIGLGGVWSWRSAKLGIPLLAELEKINWLRRDVIFAFDSDIRQKQGVSAALWALAEQLMLRGALPRMAALPDIDGNTKTGLDDFLLTHTSEQLLELLHRAQPLTLARALHGLNQNLMYVKTPGIIVERDTKTKLAPHAFTSHAYARTNVTEQTLKDDGTVTLKNVSAAQSWLAWPMRNEVGKFTYSPGNEELTTDKGVSAYNLWNGWGCTARKGDHKPFLELIKHIFTGAPAEDEKWALCWLAYPLQHPGTKMASSMVIQGTEQGTGKTLIGVTMGRIYGENYTLVKHDEITGNFNEWAQNKQFILADDFTGSDKRKDADILKNLITQESIRINAKNMPTYVVPDCMNWMFTTNHPDAFFLEDKDRRHFIHEVKVPPLSEKFYLDYRQWLKKEGGPAVFHYLLNLDLGDFNPDAPARMTLAKELMTYNVRSDLADWVNRLVTDPEHMLYRGKMAMEGDLYCSRELLALYDPQASSKVTATGMARELRKAGVPMAAGGASIRSAEGKQERYFIVRNPTKWLRATPAQAFKHIKDLSAGTK